MKRTVWIAFAALCLLLSSSWLLPATVETSPIAQQTLFYGAIGLSACALAHRKLWSLCRQTDGRLLKLIGLSILLLGLPAVLGEWIRGAISDIDRAALFALAPFIVVVVSAVREREPGARHFFVPALVGFGGALLLLPFSFPDSLRGQSMFAVLLLAILLVGFACESIHALLQGVSLLEALAFVSLSTAVFLLACHLARLPTAENWSGARVLISLHSLYSAAELALLLWLLREMPPTRLAARYLVVPLFTVFEGFALLRPAPTARMAAGLVLLLGAAAFLLFSRGGDSDTVLSIR